MTSALEFLERIIPENGYKCATTFEGAHVWNKFFATTKELANYISQQDGLGRTIYHACASFETPNNRKAENALGAKSFWLDIDAGIGKPYESAIDAANAVCVFVQKLCLPHPIYVGSGNGIHVYWPLHEMVDAETWKRYAQGLKHFAHNNTLEVDRARTADLASVLRTPGTHHRKNVVKVVQVGELVGPYELKQFDCFLEGGTRGQRIKGKKQKGTVPSIIAAAANIYGDVPTFAEPIVRSCRQLARLASSNGNLPEPDWYACIGVLSSCSDGSKYAHHWSSGYSGYNHKETQERLDRAKEFGPTTCAKFEDVSPQGCEGCQFKGKITSPIQLGRKNELSEPIINNSRKEFNSLREGSNAENEFESDPIDRYALNLADKNKNPFAPETLPRIPEGYAWHNRSLVVSSENNKGQTKYETISTYPVYIDTVQTGEVHDSQSLSLKLELPHEPPKTIIISNKVFFSSSGISEIAGAGVMVHNPELFKKFVRDSVDMWNGERKLERRYDQFGWKDDETAFLFGTKLFTANTIKTVIGSDEVQARSQYLGPRRNGSISAWSSAANQLFAIGHEAQSFALLASFAASLMRFHSSGEGGSIVSLVSDGSGTGKTTALEAAASVWGRLKGTQIIDDDTTVAKGLKLAVFGNIACTYDELYNRDPEVIRRFVLMFTNGRDKDRGTVDGTLRHVRAEWQTILLLASNNSIVDILSSMDGTDAPAYRVLEFIMNTPVSMDKRRGDMLRKQLDDNSGFAADVFLRTLIQPDILNFIKTSLPKWTDEVWNKTGLDKEHRFWVRTISSVMAAGVLVKHAGILDFSVDRISGWAIEQVQEKKRLHGELRGHRNPISMLVSFLDQHMLDTLVVPKAFKPGPNQASHVLLEPRRQLLIRHELIDHRIYIEEQTLKKWLVRVGVNTEGFFRELKEKGVLGATRRITLGAGTGHATGQITALEIIANHPMMSGHVAAIETIVTPAIKQA